MADPRHSKQTTADGIHVLPAFTYANAAARAAAVVTAADVGKMAVQTDTQEFYMLADDSPLTWTLVGATSAAPTTAQYVTLATDATLTNERVLTAGTNVSFVDTGANGTLTVNADAQAPKTAQYLTLATDATLTNERVLTAGTNISFVDAGAGGTLTISSTAGGAPANAQYVAMALDGTLTAERVLTAGSGLTLTDGGANGNATLAASSYVFEKSGALSQIVNTTTETDIINTTITGNTLGANGAINAFITGDFSNSSGAGKTLTVRIYWNGTVIYQDDSGAIASNATTRAFLLRLALSNSNATNAQWMTGEWSLSDAGGATTGTGDMAATSAFRQSNFGVTAAMAVDTTANVALRVTGQWSAASASTSLNRRHYRVEIWK